MELAERHYRMPGLRERLLGDPRNSGQVGPASLELLLLGELDALFLYESVAASLGLPSIQLPPEINLSSPAQTGRYAAVSYRAASGQTFRGAPIASCAALLEGTRSREVALEFLRFLTSPAGRELLLPHHLEPSPVLAGGDLGAMPAAVAGSVNGAYVEGEDALLIRGRVRRPGAITVSSLNRAAATGQ
jgi:hypothetical protein